LDIADKVLSTHMLQRASFGNLPVIDGGGEDLGKVEDLPQPTP
jgi:hypothetical protein